MEQKIVKYSVLSPLAKVPAYATAGAAAADLCAALEEPLTIAPMQRVLVPTGLAIELPDAGCGHWCMPAASFPSSMGCAWPTALALWTAITAAS